MIFQFIFNFLKMLEALLLRKKNIPIIAFIEADRFNKVKSLFIVMVKKYSEGPFWGYEGRRWAIFSQKNILITSWKFNWIFKVPENPSSFFSPFNSSNGGNFLYASMTYIFATLLTCWYWVVLMKSDSKLRIIFSFKWILASFHTK